MSNGKESGADKITVSYINEFNVVARVTLDEGSKVSCLVGKEMMAFVNNERVGSEHVLKNGDTVQAVPRSGKLGLV